MLKYITNFERIFGAIFENKTRFCISFFLLLGAIIRKNYPNLSLFKEYFNVVLISRMKVETMVCKYEAKYAKLRLKYPSRLINIL